MLKYVGLRRVLCLLLLSLFLSVGLSAQTSPMNLTDLLQNLKIELQLQIKLHQTLSIELTDLKKNSELLSSEVIVLSTKLANSANLINSLQEKIESLENDLVVLNSTLETSQQELKQLQLLLESLKQQLKECQDTLTLLNKFLKSLELQRDIAIGVAIGFVVIAIGEGIYIIVKEIK